MPRWLWWAPFGVFTLGCAVVGLRLGWIASTTSETDVITHFASTYVNTHGGAAKVTDCVARPGDGIPGIWIVVSCSPDDTPQRYDYYVNWLGGFEFDALPEGQGADPAEPKA